MYTNKDVYIYSNTIDKSSNTVLVLLVFLELKRDLVTRYICNLVVMVTNIFVWEYLFVYDNTKYLDIYA
jgi:hypothetical protein